MVPPAGLVEQAGGLLQSLHAGAEEGLDAELEALRSMAGRGNSGGQHIRRDELYAERLERQRGA